MTVTNRARRDSRGTAYLDRIAAQFEADLDDPALLFEGAWFTYGDLATTIRLVRDTLETTTGPGAAIGIEAPNTPQTIAGVLGTMLARRCAVPLSPRLVDDNVQHLLNELGAVVYPAPSYNERPIPGQRIERLTTPLGELVLAIIDERLDGDEDIALLLTTSGTTGEPRRVPILHRTVDAGIATLRISDGTPGHREDVNVICFPMYHLSGIIPFLLTLATGRRIALLPKFDPHVVAYLVDTYAIGALALTPTTIRMLLDADVAAERLRSLRYVRSGTAPLPVALARAFMERYGVPVIQAYGQTEAGGEVIGWDPPDVASHLPHKTGAVGRPRPGIEVRICPFDAERPEEALAAGEAGQLWLRGLQGDHEWQPSGDLATQDEDGFIWVHGRADDVILCGGFNIHPGLLESVLDQHPDIARVAVTGVDDERLGQVPVAVIVPRNGVSDDELDRWCREHLEPYQRPRRYVRVDDIPLTDTGKVHRPSLERLAMSS